MRNLYLICVALILIQFTTLAQEGWFLQNPLPQGNTLYSVYFTDSNTGWAVGDFGAILKTTDGGTSWTLQSSGTTNDLESVYFTDSNTG